MLKVLSILPNKGKDLLPLVTGMMTHEEMKKYVEIVFYDGNIHFSIAGDSMLTILKNNWRRVMRDIYEKAIVG
ncbi:MAG: hypothetical protein U0L26_15075 [Cellulosilyticum sp.]|nr:hypothetical protein [Cellulosilyticum sp.]